MKTFSIRIEEDLFDKVEQARGEKARTDFIREVIAGYFITETEPELNQGQIESLQSEISNLREIIRTEQRLKENEQKLKLQSQLIPTQEEQKEKGKKWLSSGRNNYSLFLGLRRGRQLMNFLDDLIEQEQNKAPYRLLLYDFRFKMANHFIDIYYALLLIKFKSTE